MRHEKSTAIITRNQSPDIPFDRSINPYRGCEHGCSYCYARPNPFLLGFVAWDLILKPSLWARVNAAELLEEELAETLLIYQSRFLPLPLGANTDPYQPIEREYKITRQILEVFA